MEVGDKLKSAKILQERLCPQRLTSVYHKNKQS